MTLNEKVLEITEALYYFYGSSSGYLFGIEPQHRKAVSAIVKLTLRAVEWEDTEGEEESE